MAYWNSIDILFIFEIYTYTTRVYVLEYYIGDEGFAALLVQYLFLGMDVLIFML